MIPVSEVLAAIVTFNPGDEAKALCAALRAQGCAVLVIDNASDDNDAFLADPAQADAEVIRNPENQGVAGALVQALDTAGSRGYSWLLTFDQDSAIDDGFVAALLGCPLPNEARTAIVAPRIRDRGTGTWIQGTPDATAVRQVDRVITSGALCRVHALSSVGGVRRELFIDFVDWDLCFRLRAQGWEIAVAPEAVLNHAIGQGVSHRLLGLRVVTTNHSPDRLYYRYRNFVLLAREGRFRTRSSWFLRTTLSLFATPAKILLYEDRRRAKLGAIVRGVRDGWRHRSRD